eukprot:s4654_g1.t1
MDRQPSAGALLDSPGAEPARFVVGQRRRTEQFYITRTLPFSEPPWTRSVWATSDGYFYVLRLQQAEVSHRAFVTPTLLAKAPWDHESLSYLVLDSLRDPEKLQQVSRSIQAFHEDWDMNRAVLCRAPEYVDGLLEVSHSVMWGRAIVEETASELSGTSWETLECRQLRVLQLVAELPSEKWAWRNQDRALLNGLQPLPHRQTEQAFRSSKSLTSFAASWGSPRSDANASDLEPGHGAAELLLGSALPASGAQLTLSAALLRCAGMLTSSGSTDFSNCLSLASSALAQLHGAQNGSAPTLAEAAADAEKAAAATGSCWGKAEKAFRTFSHLCSFSACESALLVLNAGPEAWEKLCRQLEGISSSLGTILPCLRLNFQPPPRAGSSVPEAAEAAGPYGLGSYGARGLGALNQMFLVLSVAAGLPGCGSSGNDGRSMGFPSDFDESLMEISWEDQRDLICNGKKAVMYH